MSIGCETFAGLDSCVLLSLRVDDRRCLVAVYHSDGDDDVFDSCGRPSETDFGRDGDAVRSHCDSEIGAMNDDRAEKNDAHNSAPNIQLLVSRVKGETLPIEETQLIAYISYLLHGIASSQNSVLFPLSTAQDVLFQLLYAQT